MRDERIRQYQRLLRQIADLIYRENKEGITIPLFKEVIQNRFRCLEKTSEKHIKQMERLRLIHINENGVIVIDYTK